MGFPGGSDGTESACNAGDMGSIPRLGRSPGEGNGNPLQYSCLENSMGMWAGLVCAEQTSRGLTPTKTNCPPEHCLPEVKYIPVS